MACIATGPSLTKADCETLKQAGVETIVINDAYRLAPWAEHLYACDAAWWNIHRGDVFKNFAGKKWSQTTQPRIKFDNAKGIRLLSSSPEAGLKRGEICTGSNSGYQAINLAYIIAGGPCRVILIGYDMSGVGSHFFGKHPEGLTANTDYSQFLPAFRKMRPEFYGVEVINCTRQTAIPDNVFKRMNLQDAIALPRK